MPIVCMLLIDIPLRSGQAWWAKHEPGILYTMQCRVHVVHLSSQFLYLCSRFTIFESMDGLAQSQGMTNAACMPAGLSRPLQESEQDVPAGNHVGTVMYTAPEIFRDSRLTKPGDVYAFGIMSKPSCAC